MNGILFCSFQKQKRSLKNMNTGLFRGFLFRNRTMQNNAPLLIFSYHLALKKIAINKRAATLAEEDATDETKIAAVPTHVLLTNRRRIQTHQSLFTVFTANNITAY